jgi:hypothetical protein
MTSEVIALLQGWPQAVFTVGKQAGSHKGHGMNSIAPSSFLKRVLLADAGVSGSVALLQLVASQPLAALTGLSTGLLLGTGAFLVGYVGLLIALAVRAQVWVGMLWLVIAGNLGWAVAALGVSASLPLSPLGHAFALVHAVAVSVFAYLEYRGLGVRDALVRERA